MVYKFRCLSLLPENIANLLSVLIVPAAAVNKVI